MKTNKPHPWHRYFFGPVLILMIGTAGTLTILTGNFIFNFIKHQGVVVLSRDMIACYIFPLLFFAGCTALFIVWLSDKFGWF